MLSNESGLLVQFLLALGVVLLLILLLAWILKKLNAVSVRVGRHGEEPRLSIREAIQVDHKRRLVLVQRDQFEHLLLVGGENDLLVEHHIPPLAAQQALAQPAGAQLQPAAPAPRPQAAPAQAQQRQPMATPQSQSQGHPPARAATGVTRPHAEPARTELLQNRMPLSRSKPSEPAYRPDPEPARQQEKPQDRTEPAPASTSTSTLGGVAAAAAALSSSPRQSAQSKPETSSSERDRSASAPTVAIPGDDRASSAPASVEPADKAPRDSDETKEEARSWRSYESRQPSMSDTAQRSDHGYGTRATKTEDRAASTETPVAPSQQSETAPRQESKADSTAKSSAPLSSSALVKESGGEETSPDKEASPPRNDFIFSNPQARAHGTYEARAERGYSREETDQTTSTTQDMGRLPSSSSISDARSSTYANQDAAFAAVSEALANVTLSDLHADTTDDTSGHEALSASLSKLSANDPSASDAISGPAAATSSDLATGPKNEDTSSPHAPEVHVSPKDNPAEEGDEEAPLRTHATYDDEINRLLSELSGDNKR